MNRFREDAFCPQCAEPVEKNWKICPACEASLISPVCPGCKMTVKEHWKRCPECEAPLLCKSCGERLPPDQAECPACRPGGPRSEPQREPLTEPVTGMVFIHVPPGSFMMGDTFGDGVENELPVHRVELDGFYMGKYPVTQAQWMAVMAGNPSKFQGETHPVEQVSWQDVRVFVRKLEAANRGAYRFFLPTEAQWEYAARSGGRQEKFAGGNDVDRVAWYEENSGGTTQPVGTREANGLGIHDMSGNVWEWCLDLFVADAYRRYEGKNPVSRGKGQDRVIRGGSWNLDGWSARCARRFSLREDLSAPGLGCRLVMMP